ncbi:PAS domain S-box-containing protein [Rhizobium soli]|uniref:histidine kinase n=1 Tax=Rhizobium soli TaxID=424798 RepID=A0A7X0JP28_9HYPH|nr:ATP-binding protein [Rhizobium soli]MBB6511184.1 PAS domain S-box-containing protein [Rhizobium soli]
MLERRREGQRILVSAPFGRDGETLSALLQEQQYEVRVCRDLRELASKICDDIGVILLTEETLSGDLAPLKDALAKQPSWSDVPFVLLAAPRSGRTPNAKLSSLKLFDVATNSVVLERPLGKASLHSAVASALRLRQKQFQMRDRLLELNESETRLRLATNAAHIGTWDFDPLSGRLSWDERCKAMFGISSDSIISYETSFLAGLHPDDRQKADEAVAKALKPGSSGEYDIEYRTIGIEDGIQRWIAAKGGAMFTSGRAVRFIGTVIDITERKRTEEALAASEAALRIERQALDDLNRTLEERVAQRTAELEEEMLARNHAEEALRQSQKMEAVGQLTGGIAHDFNNMLTGIIGGINVAKRRIANGRLDDVNRFMDASLDAANRAAALVARLLAFSRRQTLDAKPIDVNEHLAGTRDLLRRTLPENVAIEIETDPKAGWIIADANQLESALLNLAINARDAMPDGGRLTISTTTRSIGEIEARSLPGLKPGNFIVIDVSDSGSGMRPETVARAFEPFFTTKPIGQGTGLGLSMIYGFAQQSGGQVEIDSQVGVGTTIRLLFPATDPSNAGEQSDESSPIKEGQGQTVLVVEDDDSVRLLICEVLTDLSYKAIEASSADAAIPVIASHCPIDLLISDVGLPGMNGRQLAEVARHHRPELPVIFVTGYAQNATAKSEFLGPNMAMIGKPFAVEVLAAKISEMISQAERSQQEHDAGAREAQI